MIADTLHASATVEATTRAVQDVTGQGVPTGEASNNVKASMLARSSRVGIGYTASANHSVANTGYVLQPNGAVSRFAGGAVFQFVPLRSGTIAVSPSTIMSNAVHPTETHAAHRRTRASPSVGGGLQWSSCCTNRARGSVRHGYFCGRIQVNK